MKGTTNVRTTTVISNNTTEQFNSFRYFGYTTAVSSNRDLEIKVMDLIKCAAQNEEQ
jgi:hypothetical protein